MFWVSLLLKFREKLLMHRSTILQNIFLVCCWKVCLIAGNASFTWNLFHKNLTFQAVFQPNFHQISSLSPDLLSWWCGVATFLQFISHFIEVFFVISFIDAHIASQVNRFQFLKVIKHVRVDKFDLVLVHEDFLQLQVTFEQIFRDFFQFVDAQLNSLQIEQSVKNFLV